MDLLWTALVLGLAGSLHCAGMCGPLALALPAPATGSRAYVLGRLAYNGGRVMTYAVLGLFFGWLGRTLFVAGFQQWVSVGLGALLLTGLLVSPRLMHWLPVSRLVSALKQAMAGALRRRGLSSLLLLGLLNGLLPCGLVYVACAGAAATGGTGSGALYMVVFGLGTVPVMFAISLSGTLLHAAMRRWVLKAMPASVGLVAVLLILRGLGLGIPYVSPDLTGKAGTSCCPPEMGSLESTPSSDAGSHD